MTIPRKFAALLVAVVMMGLPAMACLVPDGQLTSDERECCKHMADMCGRMPMPSSHSCCKTTVRPSSDATLKMPQSVLPVMLVAVAANPFTEPATPERGVAAFVALSPPESPPSAITVLRI